jgi:general secretion pathway protein M
MIERLNPSHRRLLALLLAIGLAALVYGALVYPVLETHRRYDRSIAELSERLAAYRAAAAARGALEAAMEERRRSAASRRYFLAERSPALAAAEIQGLVKRAVEQARGELVSIQVLGTQSEESLSELAVRVRARGDVGALQKMLHGLEAGLPVLIVNNLAVESGAGVAGPPGRAPAKDLLISFEASGSFLAAPGAATKEPAR